MTIHHTIIKGAAKAGVILTHEDDSVIASNPESSLQVRLDTEGAEEASVINELAKEAWSNVLEMRDYQIEHTKIALRHEDGDFVAYRRVGRGLGEEIARDPVLEDLVVTLQEGIEPEEAADDSEEGGSVVPDRYKKLYAERGDATHCGDWLALTINGLCRVLDDKGKETTDLDRLQIIANANDVNPARYGKLGVETNGWQGRYRMTVRNMMTPRVAAKGFLFVPDGCGAEGDQEITAPKQWCLEHAPKPKAAKANKVATPEAAVKPTTKGRKAK